MHLFLGLIICLWLSTPAAASPPGVKLVVSPPNLLLQIKSPLTGGTMAEADLHVQVLAQPRQPWRLMVLAQGPLISAEGSQLAVTQIRWRGKPGGVFYDGVLSLGSPQLCGQGEGPKTGVLHFVVQTPPGTNAGNYFQKLLFSLSSP